MIGRHGFSLVEVLVALLILEVGLMGAVGMTVQAQHTLRVALAHEAVSQVVEALADSLTRFGSTGAGHREMDGGELRWSVEGSGTVRVTFQGRRNLRLEVGFLIGGAPVH